MKENLPEDKEQKSDLQHENKKSKTKTSERKKSSDKKPFFDPGPIPISSKLFAELFPYAINSEEFKPKKGNKNKKS
jgi:hypothetical protein